ncbi:unnamed protein product [Aphanomyces euteiches]
MMRLITVVKATLRRPVAFQRVVSSRNQCQAMTLHVPRALQVRFSHQSTSSEDNKFWQEIKDLHVRAHAHDAAAQYQLGLMYLEDENEQSDDDDWTLDAEAQRQRANATSSGPTDIKSIRKQARKMYKEYVLSRLQTPGPERNLITRTTKATLDAVYGSVVQPLLDGSRKLAPFNEQFVEPENNMELMEEGNAKAVEWLRHAADNGYRDAYVRLGNLCMAHDPPLVYAAIAWYSAIAVKCDAPHPDALYNLGMIYYEDHPNLEPPLKQDMPLAMSYFMKAAKIGDPSAQYFVGHILHVGNDVVPANPLSGRILLEQAASQGHGGALYYLALLYRTGDEDMGISPDAAKCIKLLEQAIAADDDEALVCLGDMYREGWPPHVNVDVSRAHELYERAAKLGNAEALCTLGALAYANELYEVAFQYYQAAADRHSMAAWKNLADMYYAGVGVPQNKKTAESILAMLKREMTEE